MKFFRFLRYDLIHGTLLQYKLFLVTILFLSLTCIQFVRLVSEYVDQLSVVTLGDFAFYAFAGMKEYIPSPTEPFEIPVIWLIANILVLFSTCSYPYRHISGLGKNILVNSGSRKTWWLSKCVWNILTVTIYYICIWLVIFIFSWFSGAALNFSISPYMPELLRLLPPVTPPGQWQLQGIILCMPWLITVALSLFQMVCALLIKPIQSFLVSIVILISSAYIFGPYLPGNYGMIVRYGMIHANGVYPQQGIIYGVILILASILGGTVLFKRYDVYGKE